MGVSGSRLLPFLEHAYDWLLRTFPAAFRARYREEMRSAFRAALDAEFAERGRRGVIAFALQELLDVATAATRERAASRAPVPSSLARRAGVLLGGACHDVRATLRKLYRSVAFAALTVTTMTLGLAVNVVLFSMLHAVRHPVLPYAQPDRLLVINEAFPANGWTQQHTSLAAFRDLEVGSRSFEALAVYSQRRVSLAVRDGSTRVQAAVVSPNLWAVLGVQPALGAGFAAADAQRGSTPSVVIGDRLWREFFGGDPGILGRTATIDGVARVIVGIMPPGFRFPEAEDMWMPLGSVVDARAATDHSLRAWEVVGRLAPGTSLANATEELRVTSSRLASEFPRTNGGWLLTAIPIANDSYEATGAFFGALQMGGLLLILLMCSNLGNLLLARGEQRRRELAICASLGASRWRLVRLLLIEVLLLAFAGVAFALVLGSWAIAALPRAIPESIPFYIHFRIDRTVVLFTAALAIGTAVLSAFGAAVRATRGDPYPALAQGAAGLVAPTGSNRMRFTLLFMQSAVAAALLSSALVVGFGVMRVQRVDLGFDPSNTVLLEIPLAPPSYSDDARARALARTLIEGVSSTANVAAAAISAPIGMFSAPNGGSAIEVDRGGDLSGANGPPASYRAVTASYFQATGMRLVSGRTFEAADREGTEDVVILNAEAARRVFSGSPAEGRRIRFGRAADLRRWRTVVGVVANTTEQPLDPEIEPRIFVPFDQDPGRTLTMTVRSAAAPETLSRTVVDLVRAADPALATETPTTAQRRLSLALWPLRFFAAFAAGFSAFALVVACSGVYGLTRYLTLARTREIALRLALGAGLAHVVLMIVRQNGAPVLAGLMVGLAASIGVSSVLQHVVVGASAFDAVAIAVAAVTLGATATLALGIPALHARRVDPAEALKVS